MREILSQEYINKRVAEIKKDIKYYSSIGLSTERDLEIMEHNLDDLLLFKHRGCVSIPGSEIDELFEKGLDLVQRRYTYLEEVASLGNNWW